MTVAGCQKTMDPINFDKVKLPNSPNYALVAPSGYPVSPDFESLFYSMTKADLSKLIVGFIREAPRLKVLSEDWNSLEFSFIQRTLLLRFPDQIDIKFIEKSDSDSTYIMLSRSQYGYSDFGKNKSRVKDWIYKWDNKLKEQPKSSHDD